MKFNLQVVVMLIAVICVSSSQAQPLDISLFDKKTRIYQKHYVALLIKKTIKLLNTEHEFKLASNVNTLFAVDKNNQSVGIKELEKCLNEMREFIKWQEDPENGVMSQRIITVQYAFLKTLYKNDIKLTQNDAWIISRDFNVSPTSPSQK